MVDQTLVALIRGELGKGRSVSSIREIYIKQGYNEKDIEEAFKYIQEHKTKKSVRTLLVALILVVIIMLGLYVGYGWWTTTSKVAEESILRDFSVPVGSNFCSSGVIRLYITNTGFGDLTSPDDFSATLDGQDISSGLKKTVIKPFDTGLILEWNCEGKCSSGEHHLRIKTASKERKVIVYCS
jgi:hypothetical protein